MLSTTSARSPSWRSRTRCRGRARPRESTTSPTASCSACRTAAGEAEGSVTGRHTVATRSLGSIFIVGSAAPAAGARASAAVITAPSRRSVRGRFGMGLPIPRPASVPTQPWRGGDGSQATSRCDVAELVPEVAVGRAPRRTSARPARAPPTASSISRWLALGLVPAGEQAVDDAHAALGRDDEPRPALAGRRARRRLARRSPARARRSCRPRSRGRRRARCLDEPRRRGRHAEPLGVRRLAALERRHAGVEDDRRDARSRARRARVIRLG